MPVAGRSGLRHIILYPMTNSPQNEETAKLILATVAEAKKYSEPYNAAQLFAITENIISQLAFFIGPLVDKEGEWRQEMQGYIEQDMSVAAAEAKAKSGGAYLLWKKMDMTYNLALQQTMAIKKFADKLEGERRMTPA